MKSGLVLTGIPVPPSSNNQYVSFVRHGRIVHVRSPELVKYRKAFDSWAKANAEAVLAIREMVKGSAIQVDAFVALHRDRLYTKRGTFKKLDVSNRLKALHDYLGDLLLVDDSHFFAVAAEKVVVEKVEDEQVIVFICPCPARTLAEVQELL